jgi:hypothetical protein
MIFHLLPRQAMPMPPPPPIEYLKENLAPRMLAVDGTLFALMMMCVMLRIYVRAVMLKTFGIDGVCLSPLNFLYLADLDMSDWIMMLAAVCYINAEHGHARDLVTLTDDN